MEADLFLITREKQLKSEPWIFISVFEFHKTKKISKQFKEAHNCVLLIDFRVGIMYAMYISRIILLYAYATPLY